MTPKKIRVLVITFYNQIAHYEVPAFRGGIIKLIESGNVLFHNHLDDGSFLYRYPLIQYKRIKGKAAIVCVGDGADAIGEFFSSCNYEINIGDKIISLKVESVRPETMLIQRWNDTFTYSIRKYLPLNQTNYEKYVGTDSLVEQYSIIERCLLGNILSFAKNMEIRFEDVITAKIVELTEEPRLYKYKGVDMMGFDLKFTSNVSLPDFIGLGRGVSAGFGMITRIKTKAE